MILTLTRITRGKCGHRFWGEAFAKPLIECVSRVDIFRHADGSHPGLAPSSISADVLRSLSVEEKLPGSAWSWRPAGGTVDDSSEGLPAERRPRPRPRVYGCSTTTRSKLFSRHLPWHLTALAPPQTQSHRPLVAEYEGASVIAIVDYQAGTLLSVLKAFDQLADESVVTADPADDHACAGKIVVPGVGNFEATTSLSGCSAGVH